MSNSSVCRRTRTRFWPASIACVVLLLSLGVGVLMQRETADAQRSRPLPAGQFQADARTLVSVFSYLFDPDVNSIPAGPPASSAALCASNMNVQPLTSASFCCHSNQSELFSELTTNAPARS